MSQDSLLDQTKDWTWVGASELLYVECHRVLERVRAQREISPDQYLESLAWLNTYLEGVTLIPVNSSIIRRAARPFPVLLKTLDALHLATLDYLAEEESPTDWGLMTTDISLGKAASLLGYRYFGPKADL